MTRRSKREIARQLDALEATHTADEESVVVIVPDLAVSEDTLPADVDPAGLPDEEIQVTGPESGAPKPAVPIQKRAELSGVACVPERKIAYWWATMSEDARANERRLREQRGEPLPPLLEAST